MSENPFDFNPRSFHAFSDKGKAALIRTDSDTAHSRIHLDMYFHRAAAGNGRFSHFLQHILTEHGRADFLSCHFLIAVGKGIARISTGLRMPLPRNIRASSTVATAKPYRYGKSSISWAMGTAPWP